MDSPDFQKLEVVSNRRPSAKYILENEPPTIVSGKLKHSGGRGELVGRWQAGGRQLEQDRIRQSTNKYSQVRTNTVKYDQIQTSTVTRTRPDRFQALQRAPDPLGRVPDPKSPDKSVENNKSQNRSAWRAKA